MGIAPHQWKMIRAAYDDWMPHIMEASRNHRKISPYFIDWLPLFTPIENDAWNSIRFCGVPLYPQVPAMDYFIDFANPYKKIGLELDGKDFHDPASDLKRDEHLRKYGWRIFRVKGTEALVPFKSPLEFEEWEQDGHEYQQVLRYWLFNTCDGVVNAIHHVYFKRNADPLEGQFMETLNMHRLAGFEI